MSDEENCLNENYQFPQNLDKDTDEDLYMNIGTINRRKLDEHIYEEIDFRQCEIYEKEIKAKSCIPKKTNLLAKVKFPNLRKSKENFVPDIQDLAPRVTPRVGKLVIPENDYEFADNEGLKQQLNKRLSLSLDSLGRNSCVYEDVNIYEHLNLTTETFRRKRMVPFNQAKVKRDKLDKSFSEPINEEISLLKFSKRNSVIDSRRSSIIGSSSSGSLFEDCNSSLKSDESSSTKAENLSLSSEDSQYLSSDENSKNKKGKSKKEYFVFKDSPKVLSPPKLNYRLCNPKSLFSPRGFAKNETLTTPQLTEFRRISEPSFRPQQSIRKFKSTKNLEQNTFNIYESIKRPLSPNLRLKPQELICETKIELHKNVPILDKPVKAHIHRMAPVTKKHEICRQRIRVRVDPDKLDNAFDSLSLRR